MASRYPLVSLSCSNLAILVATSLLLSACTPLLGTQRAAVSTSSCVHAAIKNLPPHLPDKQAHCRASALIASHCSIPEAYLAGVTKEWLDLFSLGDAEWGDLRADWAGIHCARTGHTDEEAAQCCAPWKGTIER
jgi:hypothetical protein